ncbi:MAG: hypothetical protein ACREKE_04660 [bacterium]
MLELSSGRLSARFGDSSLPRRSAVLALAGLLLWSALRAGPTWTAPALAVLRLMLWLGCNKGAFLAYYFHPLHPCVILAVAALWGARPGGGRRLEAGLVCCALLNVRFGTACLTRFTRVDFTPFHEVEGMVASAHWALVPPLLTSVATELGKPKAEMAGANT